MLKENLEKVEENIQAACDRAGRKRDEVTLIAVSKTKPVEMLQEAYDLGVRINGENKAQELASKYDDIEQLYRKFIEHSLIESQIKADALRFEPAHEGYNKLLRLHPEILKRAPLVYIASLLQMTPETLSRVRSSLL